LAIAALNLVVVQTLQASPKYRVLHGFGASGDGAGLWSSVTLDAHGNLYGATSGGGEYGSGTLFRLQPDKHSSWTENILYSFRINDPDGSGPNGGLIQDAQGNWYGTAKGGAYNSGTVFALSHDQNGWSVSLLYTFGDESGDGGAPTAGLAMDVSGNLYGTAPYGASTAFQLTFADGSWNEVLIHNFGVKKGDGAAPFAGLILDGSGNLYGATRDGGTGCVGEGCGTVYELIPTAKGAWKEKVLHRFDNNGKDGVEPGWGMLALDASGSLYGTTEGGGTNSCFAGPNWIAAASRLEPESGNGIGNCGTIFKVSKEGNWKESVLYSFQGGSRGSGPGAGVVMDKSGNLYGTTVYAGSGCGCGVVYKLGPVKHGKWKYTVLHTFQGFDGAQPDANLIIDGKGNLYGTTATGGILGGGVVFEITP
jgi:uncharacterized repeat protein (TIGR03803 family)